MCIEKEAVQQKLMVPEIDGDSRHLQNIQHFLTQLLPLLEHLRKNSPGTYQSALAQFRSHWEGKVRANNLRDTLEYLLIFMQQNFGMQFFLEEDESEYRLECIECPLVREIHNRGMDTEMERKTLCYHCSHYHYMKFFDALDADSNLSLYPSGCHFRVEKVDSEPQNPLFY